TSIPHRSLCQRPRPRRLDWPSSRGRRYQPDADPKRANACGCPPPELEPNRDRPFRTASPALSMAGAVARVRFWGVARKASTMTPRRSGRHRAEPRLAVWPSRSAGAVTGNRTVQRRAFVVNRSARATREGRKKLPNFIVRLLTFEDI